MSNSRRWCALVLGTALTMWLALPILDASAEQTPATVNMTNTSFLPAEVHVAPGATVRWVNSSVTVHTVTADDGTFDSSSLAPGTSYEIVFDVPGIYQYYSQPEGSAGLQGMAATVVVDDPNVMPAPTVQQRTPDDYQPTETD